MWWAVVFARVPMSATADLGAAWAAERHARADLEWLRSMRDQALDELLVLGVDDTSPRAESLRRRVATLDEISTERSADWAKAHSARLTLGRPDP
jgi:hypothetical protein